MTATDAERMDDALRALAWIAFELGFCVSLHRNGELDTPRLAEVRDFARRAYDEGEATP